MHYVTSSDRGARWSTIPIANEASTHPDAPVGVQWGDSTGVSVVEGRAVPAWADRRADIAHGLTQAFSAVAEGGSVGDLACPPAQIAFDPSAVRVLGAILLLGGLYVLLVKKDSSWWVWLLSLLGVLLVTLAIYVIVRCWTAV